MKKIIVLIAVLSLALTLAACGSKNAAQSSTTAAQSNIDTTITSPVTITFWTAFQSGAQTILQNLVNNFEKDNPNITVQLESQDSYTNLHTKVVNAIVTGTEPDMLIGYPDDVADYMQGNAVVNLDPYFNDPTVGYTKAQLADFVPSYLQENDQFGYYTGLPFNKSTEVLVYNKTFFDQEHLTVPQTWTDAANVAAQIHSLTGTGWGLSYDSTGNLFTTMIHQWGGQYTDQKGDLLFNSQQTIDALSFYQTEHTAGAFTDPSQWQDTYSSDQFVISPVLNSQGQFTGSQPKGGGVYMMISSTAGMSYNVPAGNAFEIGVAPIPYNDKTNLKAVIQQGTDISIMSSANSQQRLAAWLLMKYLASEPVTIQWAEQSGYLPVLQSAYQDAGYKAWLLTGTGANPNYNALEESVAAEETGYMFTDPAFPGSNAVRNEATTLIGNLLFPASGAASDPATLLKNAIHSLSVNN